MPIRAKLHRTVHVQVGGSGRWQRKRRLLALRRPLHVNPTNWKSACSCVRQGKCGANCKQTILSVPAGSLLFSEFAVTVCNSARVGTHARNHEHQPHPDDCVGAGRLLLCRCWRRRRRWRRRPQGGASGSRRGRRLTLELTLTLTLRPNPKRPNPHPDPNPNPDISCRRSSSSRASSTSSEATEPVSTRRASASRAWWGAGVRG